MEKKNWAFTNVYLLGLKDKFGYVMSQARY